MFISPFFVLFAVFGLFPIVFTFYLSFFRWNALTPMKFVGLQNYQFIFEDKTFWTSVMNTFLMGAMGTISQLIVALLLAVTLNSAVIRFRRFFRTLYFMPTVTLIVAVTLVFSAVFGNQGWPTVY